MLMRKVMAWGVGLLLAGWVPAVVAAEAAGTGAVGGEPAVSAPAAESAVGEVNPQGHRIPEKGALISELREDLLTDLVGDETVIRLYEDRFGNQVREFTVNGAVFQVEVAPAQGVSYLLIDKDGDGLFETRMAGDLDRPRLIVPQWVLFRF